MRPQRNLGPLLIWSRRRMKKVWHAAYLDEAGHWCEACGDAPEGTKVYIDDYTGYNPAFWCEHCIKSEELMKFEVIGWLETNDEYMELEKRFHETRR